MHILKLDVSQILTVEKCSHMLPLLVRYSPLKTMAEVAPMTPKKGE
jgi:hypothetical protein